MANKKCFSTISYEATNNIEQLLVRRSNIAKEIKESLDTEHVKWYFSKNSVPPKIVEPENVAKQSCWVNFMDDKNALPPAATATAVLSEVKLSYVHIINRINLKKTSIKAFNVLEVSSAFQ